MCVCVCVCVCVCGWVGICVHMHNPSPKVVHNTFFTAFFSGCKKHKFNANIKTNTATNTNASEVYCIPESFPSSYVFNQQLSYQILLTHNQWIPPNIALKCTYCVQMYILHSNVHIALLPHSIKCMGTLIN